MTGSDILSMAETLVDETISETIAYQLINNKINEIESEREWSFLREIDTSLSALSTDTYATAKALPADCAVIKKLEVGSREYRPLPLKEFDDYKEITGYYFTDGNYFYLSGTVPETKDIRISYQKFSTEITSSTSPSFPSRFHKMFAFFLAADFYIMDAGEKNMSWHNEWNARGEMLLSQMRLQDAKILANEGNTLRAMNINYIDAEHQPYHDDVLY